MPQIHGRNQKLFVWDSAAACQDISGDLNNITLGWSRDNPEVTTLGDDSLQRISGLRDVSLTIAAIWNTGTGNIQDVLDELASGSTISLVKYYPAGQTTGCAFWTGCFLLSSWEFAGPVNGPVANTVAFQLASGSLSASTV